MKKSGNKPKQRRRVVWDEDNLDFNEAHRSPKQKIDEPKTPYHQLSIDSDTGEAYSPFHSLSGSDTEPQSAHAEAIREALAQVATSSGSSVGGASASGTSLVRKRSGGWTSSEDEASDMDRDEAEDGEASESRERRHGKEQVSFREGSDTETSPRDPTTERRFREMRRRHYDEFHKAKALLRNGSVNLDEPEDVGPDKNHRSSEPSGAEGIGAKVDQMKVESDSTQDCDGDKSETASALDEKSEGGEDEDSHEDSLSSLR